MTKRTVSNERGATISFSATLSENGDNRKSIIKTFDERCILKHAREASR